MQLKTWLITVMQEQNSIWSFFGQMLPGGDILMCYDHQTTDTSQKYRSFSFNVQHIFLWWDLLRLHPVASQDRIALSMDLSVQKHLSVILIIMLIITNYVIFMQKFKK